MKEALRLGVPLIYFRGIAAGQYAPVAPIILTRDDAVREVVSFHVALPVADTTPAGVTSDELTRRYATRGAVPTASALLPPARPARISHPLRGLCAARSAAPPGRPHHRGPGSPWVCGGHQRDRPLRYSPPRLRPQPPGHRARRIGSHCHSLAGGDRRADASRRPPRLSPQPDHAAARPS